MPDKTLLIRDVPEELHRDFKTLCAREGVTMSWKVKEMMEVAVNLKELEREVWKEEIKNLGAFIDTKLEAE